MNKHKKRHIVVVNAIYPPDRGASGRASYQLVQSLRKRNFQVTILTTDKSYNDGVSCADDDPKIIRIKSRANRSSYWKRFFTSFLDSRALLKKCAKIEEVDAFILCTDPPFLSYLAPGYLKEKKLLIWAMDLYPEAFIAKNFISHDSWITKHYHRKIKQLKNQRTITLGQGQHNYLASKKVLNTYDPIIIPCGLISPSSGSSKKPDWKQSEKVTFGYIGNLGEAHSASFLKDLITKSDPEKHHFVLRIFGQKAKSLIKPFKGLPHVTTLNWINEDVLCYIDIQIVSLLSKWTHICVPSKAVSAICCHTPILFHGSSKGDTYRQFKSAMWFINDGDDVNDGIEQFYASLQKEEVLIKKREAILAAEKIKKLYQAGIDQLEEFLSL